MQVMGLGLNGKQSVGIRLDGITGPSSFWNGLAGWAQRACAHLRTSAGKWRLEGFKQSYFKSNKSCLLKGNDSSVSIGGRFCTIRLVGLCGLAKRLPAATGTRLRGVRPAEFGVVASWPGSRFCFTG